MKNLNKCNPLLWTLFHGLLIGAFLLSLLLPKNLARPIQFKTSLFDILPPSHSLKSVSQADTILSNKTSRAITIFVESQDFNQAKSVAEKAYLEWEKNPLFESLELYSGESSLSELTDFLFQYRYNLLSPRDPQILSETALATAFGAFSLTQMNLEKDPFLLTEQTASSLLEKAAASATGLSPKDGVLATQKDDKWYVMIRGLLSPEATSLTNKKSGVKVIYESAGTLEKEGQVRFIYSGVPFHSYESSSSAQKEITIISIVGILLIIALFLFIFSSLIPALFSAMAIIISSATAMAVTLLLFRQVHVLTFVFGTTLIGTCIDYSIHFFVNWKANPALKDGLAIRSHIFRGIGLSFLSTEICFAALFFAPFPLLKQVSVFLFTGLLSSFLTVVCLYPRLKVPQNKRSIPLIQSKIHLPQAFRFFPLLLVGGSVLSLAIFHKDFRIYNDLKGMYSMSDHLLENEALSSQLLNSGSVGWYYIVGGKSPEEVLQKEEALTASLPSALSVSAYLPSIKTQEKNYQSLQPLLELSQSQYEILGFEDPAALARDLEKDYLVHKGDFISPDTPLPQVISQVMENLWIGQVGDQYYSCVMPLHVKTEEIEKYQALSREIDGVTFVNKVEDIGRELDALTKMMVQLLALAFVLVVIILAFIYPKKILAKIAAIPLIVCLTALATLAACHLTLGFFAVTSLVLVFGLGLDYIIYTVEAGAPSTSTSGISTSNTDASRLSSFAILLSFITTALSFGVLAFTSFTPVHIMGLTVFAGLTAACTTAFASSIKKR